MNVFKRIGDIISSNLNSALDRMEDPEKMIDLSIRELEDAVIKMKADLRDKKVEEKRGNDLIHDIEDSIERWSERARLAAEKGEDDMAREALAEKRALKEKLSIEKESLKALRDLLAAVEENIKDAEEKLSEMKLTSSSLKARAKLAKDRMEVNRKVNESANSSYSRRLEELKLKIEKWENIANISHSEIRKEEKKPTFEDLERDAEIERELEELKKERKKDKKEN